MSTPSIEILNEKIRKVQRRRKWIFALRQISSGLVAFIALFLILGYLEMRVGFTHMGRILLFGTLLSSAGFLTWWHFRVIRRFSSSELELAHYVEEHIPELQQRLLTSMEYRDTEKKGFSPQLLEKLWEDARAQVQLRKIEKVTSTRSVWPAAASAFFMLGLVLFGIRSLPDFGPAGRQILWPWTHPAASVTPSLSLIHI